LKEKKYMWLVAQKGPLAQLKSVNSRSCLDFHCFPRFFLFFKICGILFFSRIYKGKGSWHYWIAAAKIHEIKLLKVMDRVRAKVAREIQWIKKTCHKFRKGCLVTTNLRTLFPPHISKQSHIIIWSVHGQHNLCENVLFIAKKLSSFWSAKSYLKWKKVYK
jgi:hypothetical protein